MKTNELSLSVFTPERAILRDESVESIVLPGEMGQFNVLPGHTNFVTSLRHGVFGYKIKGEWSIAFLSGGFTQVFDGAVTVLAETVEMEQELDVAKAELEVQELAAKWKSANAGSSGFADLSYKLELAQAKLRAAKKKLH